MLYIDQPVQVGLSYDTLQNVTYDLLFDNVSLLNDTSPTPKQNATFMVGTWASGDGNNTARGSVAAAVHMWHFLQVWTRDFPEYNTSDSRISLAAESYGGKYGPDFFYFFQKQNENIAATTCSDPCPLRIFNLDTPIIVNSCIDSVQEPPFPHTGESHAINNGEPYQSNGPSSSWQFKTKPPAQQPLAICYTWDLQKTCTEEQMYELGNGTALVQDYVFVDKNATQLYPEIVGDGDMRGIAFTHDHPLKL